MAIESPTTPLGSPLVEASLPDLRGQTQRLEELRDGAPLLVAFVCNHCPYVRHIEQQFGKVATDLMTQGLKVVAVCSNDAEAYPDDAPEHLAEQQRRAEWSLPYLLDTDQQFALATGAVCTPDLFLYDADGHLAYRGAFDGATPKNGVEVDGSDLRQAAQAVLRGEPVPTEQRSSLGCGIKWKPGNDPS
ncbi:MAG: thioredoxin family protein [Nitriliruptoraceae bacterium]